MADERGSFRRRLFGGFDRVDVINYIEDIAIERNKHQETAAKLQEEVSELRDQAESLTKQLDDKNAQLAEKSDELSTAHNELNEVWNELRDSSDELEALKAQLEQTKKELASKTAQYDNDIAAAQKALNEAKAQAELQRLEAKRSASQIISTLRDKYEGSMSSMNTAFADAEAELEKLL
ncbi:MAG: hypothetical protein E7456_07020 [Ruminococcaceae bacterium]|nr:hypothetical protein [Oscillospiraceae bacterium]